jgi:activator of HSP90 ATPase
VGVLCCLVGFVYFYGCNSKQVIMMEFTVKAKIKATAKEIYNTWLSSEGHSNMTGGEAIVSDKVGGDFLAWDGYIAGSNILLEQYHRIKQHWRTSDFDESDEDSMVEITLDETNGETELTLTHSNLPKHGEQYKKGWEEHYFQPMKNYFDNN